MVVTGAGTAVLSPPPSTDAATAAVVTHTVTAQSDIVEMAHTALGHLEELKKKELVLVSTSFLSFRYAFVIPFCLFLTMCISVTIKY